MTDDLGVLVEFADRLRAAGVQVEHSRLYAAAEALTLAPLLMRPTPYWPLRLTLCGRRADLATFDAVYRAWWADAARKPVAADAGLADVVTAESGSVTIPGTGDGSPSPDGAAGAAHEAALATRDVRSLSDAEKAVVADLIARLSLAARPARRVPQRVAARSGVIDVGRTVRLMVRDCGDPTRLLRRRRTVRPRRLLFLIDISKSMQVYSDMLLLFAHAALAAGPDTTEVFTIGTRWTRITAELLAHEPQQAMRAVADVETDWHLGTQLGRSLLSFLRRWSGHRVLRSAVVVIGSDGLEEAADQTLMPRQVARLSRIAHRLIWVNPQRRWPGYRPLDTGLRDSLRHVDRQLSGHSLDDLRTLAEAIGP